MVSSTVEDYLVDVTDKASFGGDLFIKVGISEHHLSREAAKSIYVTQA